MTLRRSPLDAVHRALDARMVPFGGWDMPVQYPTGTLAEHRACRTDAVVFDVSHLGTVRVTGADAVAVLQATFTNDLDKIDVGRAQYTHLCADDGSVVDDIITWWRAADHLDVMPNASNTDGVLTALAATAEHLGTDLDCHAEDVTAGRAVLAVQGPAARERLAGIVPAAAAVGRFRVETFTYDGVECVVAGTGYTGEDGVEMAVPVAVAAPLWAAVTGADVTPAGLGARDTLRLEAGLPLHGHELGPGITPLQAGLGWVVGWDKPTFGGRDALLVERETGVTRTLRGLAVDGRRPPRQGQPVSDGDGPIGEVTSGNFSPMLGHGIALAMLPPEIEDGTAVTIDVRGTHVAATVCATPFISR